jgi:hypothetical protein
VAAPVASDSLLTYTHRLHCPLRTTPRPSFIKSPHELCGLPRDYPSTAHLLTNPTGSTFHIWLGTVGALGFWGLVPSRIIHVGRYVVVRWLHNLPSIPGCSQWDLITCCVAFGEFRKKLSWKCSVRSVKDGSVSVWGKDKARGRVKSWQGWRSQGKR